jgi:Flp pilus assembly protein CpaB
MTDLTMGRRSATSGDGLPSSRTITRRRSLPGGRAVVGAFLVTVAAVGLFAAFTRAAAGPSTSYVVAARDVPIGAQLTAADLALVPLELPAAQRARAFDDIAVLEGVTVIGPLSSGDLVQSSSVVAAEAGVEEISFPVAAERAVAGRLLPGERVDVLATYGSGAGAYTTAVARDALVLAVEDGGGTALGGSEGRVLTLGTPDSDTSLRVAHAVSAGEVMVVRASGAQRTGLPPADYRPPDPLVSPSP